MSKIIVFGAHGKVGQRVVQLLAKTPGFHATAVVRNSEQANQIAKIAQNPVSSQFVSLSEASVDELTHVVSGHSAIVLSVGSRGKDLLKVDLDGVVKTFEAAVQANVRRVVLVSAVYAQDREFGAASPLRDYYIAKHYADRILQSEFKDSLDFTILRPSALTDGEETGRISFLAGEKDVGSVDRADVASVIVEVLKNTATFGKAYDFKSGTKEISAAATWN